MTSRDPRVDAYIEKSADFAKPVLTHIRDTVHTAAPDTQETIKWGFPHFMYAGKILCSMAGFKEHCALHFWKGGLVIGDEGAVIRNGMGQFGRITKLSDLPSTKTLTVYIDQAIKLNEERAKTPSPAKPRNKRPELETPAPLLAALNKNRKAKANFESLSPSDRREYVEWIIEAKTDTTRDKRIATTAEWLTDGKSRNWKHERT